MTYLEVATEAAKKGGEVVGRYFETTLLRHVKDDNTFVTIADRESETAIISEIKKHFPDHSFLGEEGGETKTDSSYQWVIDPLDGTTNFINGLPLFCVSVALLHKGDVIVSVIYQPLLKLLFHAERGKGMFCNGKRANVSEQDAKSGMVTVGIGKGSAIKERVANMFREAPKHIMKYRYLGSAALELAYLARGGTEGVVNLGSEKWDYAAGTLLVEEAGGKITDFNGRPWTFEERFFVASNGVVHDNLLRLVATAS